MTRCALYGNLGASAQVAELCMIHLQPTTSRSQPESPVDIRRQYRLRVPRDGYVQTRQSVLWCFRAAESNRKPYPAKVACDS
jgi:hypothetical protein